MKRLLFLASLSACLTGACSKSPGKQTVVVYTSVDDVFARPVAEEFQRATGIEVKLVPDTEETKSAGLVNGSSRRRTARNVMSSGAVIRSAPAS